MSSHVAQLFSTVPAARALMVLGLGISLAVGYAPQLRAETGSHSVLVILAECESPDRCVPSVDAATVIEYPRFVDCVRAKAIVVSADAWCAGEAFYPPHADRG